MKKALLITEGFYDYDEAIKKNIEETGYEVKLYQATVTLSYFEKLLHKRDMDKYLMQKRRDKQVEMLQFGQYDLVLVICGHSLEPDIFREFCKGQTKAKFVLYLWDDIGRVKTYHQIADLFERIITFDRHDAKNFHLEFRPLFFLEGYRYNNQQKQHKACFIGWLHSDRKDLVYSLVKKYFSKEQNFIYFLTGQFTLWKEKIKGKDKEMVKYFHTEKLSSLEAMKALCESEFTIDIQHGTQKGLTMRTIESIAAHTKLITTNEEVQYYDFYNPSNVCIIDRGNPMLPQDFLESKWQEIPEEITEKYSIKTWVKDVIESNGKQNFLM